MTPHIEYDMPDPAYRARPGLSQSALVLTSAETKRFWRKVDKDGPQMSHMETPCWVWVAAKKAAGYGVMWLRGRLERAHRVSFELHKGPLGALDCCHKCDVPACVRPEHLFAGTRVDNMRDCAKKGRSGPQLHPHKQARGSRNGNSKLAESDISLIRAAYANGETLVTIAERYSVDQSCISKINLRKTWRHIL